MWKEVEDFVDCSAKEIIKNVDREFADKKAEKFICEWTCAESLEEMKRDSWSTSDVHSILMDFILSQKSK